MPTDIQFKDELRKEEIKLEEQIEMLKNKEYELLLLFLRNPGIALFRDRIYQLVWGGEYSGDSRTVDLHVQRLRKKLQWEGKLFAVYKIGYRLEGGREREPR